VSQALLLGLNAFIVGLSGAMAPGPYLTVTITRTLQQGRLSALLMLIGHAALEGLLLIGFAFGLQHFLVRDDVSLVLAIAGGAVLLWMGQGLLRGALTGRIKLRADSTQTGSPQRFGPILHGALVSVSNPYWTLWWATIGVKLAADGLAIGPIGVAAFFIGHQLADVVWYSAVVSAVSAGRRVLSDTVYRIAIAVCASFLLYLGVRFLLGAIQ
jgi:threonine/homoserine/homoserine lactone efflux protein